MLNRLFALLGGVFVALILSGCGTPSGKLADQPQVYDARCKFPGTEKLAPDWICRPNYPGYAVVHVEAADPTKAGYSFQERTAFKFASARLAARLETIVNAEFDAWISATGKGDNEVVGDHKEDTVALKVHGKLNGATVIETLQGPDGKLWMVMGMDAKSVQEYIQSATIKSSYKNDEALWQEFQAKKAQDKLAGESAR